MSCALLGAGSFLSLQRSSTRSTLQDLRVLLGSTDGRDECVEVMLTEVRGQLPLGAIFTKEFETILFRTAETIPQDVHTDDDTVDVEPTVRFGVLASLFKLTFKTALPLE